MQQAIYPRVGMTLRPNKDGYQMQLFPGVFVYFRPIANNRWLLRRAFALEPLRVGTWDEVLDAVPIIWARYLRDKRSKRG